jgi:hypothetical protein
MATSAPCWPDNKDWLDGKTEIEVSARHLKAHWDADILDTDDKNKHDRIIDRDDTFQVRFRVQLEGRLWKCICGSWRFDLGFTAIGKGTNFDLSDYLANPAVLQVNDWRGCDTLCIELLITVPAGTIPADKYSTVYEIAAKFELRCCDEHVAVAGYEALEEYQFV